MKLFILKRTVDVTGISGTGIVAEGVIFSNGKCSMSWRSKTTSTVIYDSLEDIQKIHCHEGTEIVLFDIPNFP